jgi:hypothetical protein
MSSASISIRRKDRPGLTSFSIPVIVLWWVIPPVAFALAPLVILFCLLDGLDPMDRNSNTRIRVASSACGSPPKECYERSKANDSGYAGSRKDHG